MNVGLIGSGKMGLPLALNMQEHHHQVSVFVRKESAKEKLNHLKIAAFVDLKEWMASLTSPKIIWMMIPSGHQVDEMIERLRPHLEAGDVLIDGGNSHYKDTLRRHAALEGTGIHYMDIGTSGGIDGARNGACLMVGGDERIFAYLEPLLKDIAMPNGYGYMGASGSGHYVKMIHNGIEYGMMQAIGEGFEVLKHSDYELDLQRVANVWSHGSIIEGLLMRLTASALDKNASLDAIEGIINDSGEGRWTIEEALDLEVAVPTLTQALMTRYKSRDPLKFSEKVVASLRNEFGGHATFPRGKDAGFHE